MYLTGRNGKNKLGVLAHSSLLPRNELLIGPLSPLLLRGLPYWEKALDGGLRMRPIYAENQD